MHHARQHVLRPMRQADVAAVLAVQEPGAIRGLAEIFPQDEYPFPRAELADRWRREIDDSEVDCFVVVHDGVVSGFAATKADELLHFGIAVEHWGSGLATQVHDEVLEHLAGQGIRRAWLRIFAGNFRGRRFYEKLGWVPTGERTRSSFPPHAELLRYERDIDGD